MAYFEDLTPYRYLVNRPAAINVGWLSRSTTYSKGRVEVEVLEKLRELAVTSPINQTRGFHVCEFCEAAELRSDVIVQWRGRDRKLGSAEIWVTSPIGVKYASPNLIIHYIEYHGYSPPSEYLQALSG